MTLRSRLIKIITSLVGDKPSHWYLEEYMEKGSLLCDSSTCVVGAYDYHISTRNWS